MLGSGRFAGGGHSEKELLTCSLQEHWLCQSLASVRPTTLIASFQGTFSLFYFVSLEGDFVNTIPVLSEARFTFCQEM